MTDPNTPFVRIPMWYYPWIDIPTEEEMKKIREEMMKFKLYK